MCGAACRWGDGNAVRSRVGLESTWAKNETDLYKNQLDYFFGGFQSTLNERLKPGPRAPNEAEISKFGRFLLQNGVFLTDTENL